MTLRILSYLCLATCLLFVSPVQAQETVHLATGEWPPFMSENFQFGGFGTKICTEAFALAGLKTKYSYMPWKRAYESTKLGQFAASPGWRKTPEREVYFYFSDPLFSAPSAFFYRKDTHFDWKSLNDVKDMTIGVTLGYTHESLLKPIVDKGKGKLDIAPTDGINISKLISGRIDIFPCSIAVGYYLLHTQASPSQAASITHHPLFLESNSLYLMISKKIPNGRKLIARFNKGLKMLRESGRYDLYLKESLRGDYIPKK